MKGIYLKITTSKNVAGYSRLKEDSILICVTENEKAQKLKTTMEKEINLYFSLHLDYIKSLLAKYEENKDMSEVEYDIKIINGFLKDFKLIKEFGMASLLRRWFPFYASYSDDKEELKECLIKKINWNSSNFNPRIEIKDIPYFK